MRNALLTSILFLFLFSCAKTDDDLATIDCSHYFDIIPYPLSCNGPVCQSDTCNTYYAVWKDMFLSENQMTEEYFNNHITICKTGAYEYDNQGIQFEITYKLTIDWFEAKFEEGFMIWLFPSYLTTKPAIELPAGVLLSKDQIVANVDNPFFGYAIHKITSIDHLNYSSRQEAVTKLANAAGVNDMCMSSLFIEYQELVNLPKGHPVLAAGGALNWDKNNCVSGIMDLASDYLEVEVHDCVISLHH